MSEQSAPPQVVEQAPPPVGPAIKKGLAITALVLGIVAIAGSWIPLLNITSILIGVVGLVFGVIAMIKAFKATAGGKTMAIVGTGLSALAIILSISVNAAAANAVDEVLDELDGDIAAVSDETGVQEDADGGEDPNAGDADEPVAGLVLVDAQTWQPDSDGGYWDYYVLVQNPSDEAVYTWESFDVELVDADGVILDSDSSYPTVLPGMEIALAGTFYDSESLSPSQVAGVQVRLPSSPSQFVGAGEAGALTVSEITAADDRFGVAVSGIVESSFAEDQENAFVQVVAFDADGNAVSQQSALIDRIPTGGKARFEVSLYELDSATGVTFEAWPFLH